VEKGEKEKRKRLRGSKQRKGPLLSPKKLTGTPS